MSFIQMGNAWRRSGERQREQQEREAEMAQREIQREALSLGLQQARERPVREAQQQAQRVLSRRRGAQILRNRLGDRVKGMDDDMLGELWERPELAKTMLEPPGDDVNWQEVTGGDNRRYERNPRTGQVRPMMGPDGRQLSAPPPASLQMQQPVQFLQTPGGYVSADPRNPGAPAKPVVGADGQQVRPAAGGVEVEKRAQVLRNVTDALDGFERTLRSVGSVLDPRKPEHGVLQTAYENYQLQLKELYALGVLAGPDLMLMRRIVNDPTDPRTRLTSGGSAEKHAARVMAQIGRARQILGNYVKNATPGTTRQGSPQGVSDDDVNAIIGRYRGGSND